MVLLFNINFIQKVIYTFYTNSNNLFEPLDYFSIGVDN